MFEVSELIHYATVALTVGINSVGVGLGEGMTSYSAIKAIHRQPAARADITRTAILGMALIETAAVMGISMSFVMLNAAQALNPVYARIAELGITFAICFSGFIIGIVSAFPAQRACESIARQPFFSQKIMRFMLITQSIIQTPIIFGFIIAIFIRSQATIITTFPEALKLIAAGLCIGLGSVGPAIGLAHFAQTACAGIGVNRESYAKLFSFTLISEAIIETPIIFAFVISLLILYTPLGTTAPAFKSLALLGAALATAFGTFGPGISSGKTSAAACKQIAFKTDLYEELSKLSIFSQGIIDTAAIYALLISLLLIYFV